MYQCILHFCRVPENEALKILESIKRYEDGDKNEIKNGPQMQLKRSYMAWTLVFVYFESPYLILLFIFTFGFYIPFIFIRLLLS